MTTDELVAAQIALRAAAEHYYETGDNEVERMLEALYDALRGE